MAIGWQHVIGIALVLILIAGVGLLSGRRSKMRRILPQEEEKQER